MTSEDKRINLTEKVTEAAGTVADTVKQGATDAFNSIRSKIGNAISGAADKAKEEVKDQASKALNDALEKSLGIEGMAPPEKEDGSMFNLKNIGLGLGGGLVGKLLGGWKFAIITSVLTFLATGLFSKYSDKLKGDFAKVKGDEFKHVLTQENDGLTADFSSSSTKTNGVPTDLHIDTQKRMTAMENMDAHLDELNIDEIG